MSEPKRLYREEDGMIFGVCAGIGTYMDLDPTVVRLLFIFGTLFVGGGILAYIILTLIVPKRPIY